MGLGDHLTIMEILFLVLLFLSFSGYILWGQSKTGWRFEIMPVVVICAQVLILYLGSLFHLLYLSSILLFIAGLALFAYMMLVPNRAKVGSLIKGFPAFFYVFLFAFFLSWYFAQGKTFTGWDEFSHWGLVIKTMVLTDALPTPTSSVYLLSYPVGTGLFQYYVTRVLQAFQPVSSYPLVDESRAYFGNYLFLGMPLFVLSSNFRKGSVFYYLPLLFGCYFLNFFGGGVFIFYSLYTDGLLGILFGAGLILAISHNEGYTVKNIIPISIVASALVLVKLIGIVFSALLVFPVVFSLLYQLVKQGRLHRSSGMRYNSAFILNSGLFLLLIALPLLTYFSWSWHVKNLDANDQTGATLSNFSEWIQAREETFSSFKSSEDNIVLSFIRQMVPLEDRTLIREFVKSYFTKVIGFSQQTTQRLIIIYLVLIFISLLWANNNRRKLLALNIFAIVGFIVYGLALLFLYLFLFGEDGRRLPSLDRYISSYLLGWGMLIFYGLVQPVAAIEGGAWGKKNIFALALTTLIIGILLGRVPSGYINATRAMPESRVQARAVMEDFAPAMKPNGRIYHIMQDAYDLGYYHYILRLEAIPRYIHFGGWSLGRRYRNKDIYTINYRPDEWFALLKDGKYDYVLITHADARFWSTYGSLFAGQSEEDIPQLFEVGDTKLIRIK